jgi:hypothetical protein
MRDPGEPCTITKPNSTHLFCEFNSRVTIPPQRHSGCGRVPPPCVAVGPPRAPRWPALPRDLPHRTSSRISNIPLANPLPFAAALVAASTGGPQRFFATRSLASSPPVTYHSLLIARRCCFGEGRRLDRRVISRRGPGTPARLAALRGVTDSSGSAGTATRERPLAGRRDYEGNRFRGDGGRGRPPMSINGYTSWKDKAHFAPVLGKP